MNDENKHIGTGVTIVLLIMLMSLVPKCGSEEIPTAVTVRSIEHRIDSNSVMAGHFIIEIRPLDGAIEKQSASDDDRYVITCGKTQVVIDNTQLFVNEQQYGSLDGATKILVDGPTVYVDNTERLPAD